MMKTLRKLLVGLFFFGSFVSVSYGGFSPKNILTCVVGSFDSQNVQLKCGPQGRDKRQMSRSFFTKFYGEPEEGKVVKIDTGSTAVAGQVKSY